MLCDLLVGMSRTGQPRRTERKSVVARGRGRVGAEIMGRAIRIVAKRDVAILQNDESVLETDSRDGYTTC